MKIAIPKNDASLRELPPVGLHIARCCAIVDLGTQTGSYAGRPTIGRKIQVSFELPSVGNSKTGNPLKVMQIYTVSMHRKARLRMDIESWRGNAFSDEGGELDTFELSWMLGRYCQMYVSHYKKDGDTYAKMERISPVAEGTTLPDAVNEPVFFSLDEPDLKYFAPLSTGVKTMIQTSPEWKRQPFADNWLDYYNRVAANEPAF